MPPHAVGRYSSTELTGGALAEYGRTGLGTTAPRTEPEAVRLAFTSATKRYGLCVRERNVKAVLKFTQRTLALVNEAPEFGFEFLAAE